MDLIDLAAMLIMVLTEISAPDTADLLHLRPRDASTAKSNLPQQLNVRCVRKADELLRLRDCYGTAVSRLFNVSTGWAFFISQRPCRHPVGNETGNGRGRFAPRLRLCHPEATERPWGPS